MKYSLLPILAFFLFLPLFTKAQGESCATAVQIGNLPYNTPFLQNHNTCNSGNNYSEADKCGNRYMNGNEFVFEYTPTNDECVSATASPSDLLGDFRNAIFIVEGCPDDVNSKCVAQIINPDGGSLPLTLPGIALTGGETYYFIVSSFTAAECFTFTFNLAAAACDPYDTGGTCDNAEEIDQFPYDASGTTCNHNGIVTEGNECYSTFYNDSETYLYSYTPDNDECIRVIGSTTDGTMRMSLHAGCPTESDTTCQESQYYYTFGEQTDYFSLDSGVTYYFALSGSACTAYNLQFSAIPDSGATCQNAWEMDLNGGDYYENLDLTTRCMGDDYKVERTCLTSTRYDDGNDVLFRYESPGNECIAASIDANGSYASLSMFKDCPSTANDSIYASDCTNFSNGYKASIEYTIDEPGVYYFVVSGYSYQFSPTSTRFVYDRDFDFRFSRNVVEDLGKDCDHADVVPSNPDLYVSKPGISVQCKNNDYSDEDACDNPLINGSDYVLTYTAPRDYCGTIVGKNVRGDGGILVLDQCPSPAATCFGATACEVACDSIYVDLRFEAGQTYYIIGAASNGNFFEFDLEIKKRENTPDGCPECASEDCEECLNANFELGTFRRWDGFTGVYANPKVTAGLDTTYTNDPLSRHTIVNAGGYDPVVGDNNLRTTGPLGNRYAVRIGNRGTGKQADVLTYAFTVTPATRNFFYYYAVVFEDPDHPEGEQPFFSVEMVAIDDNGVETPLGCAEYEVRPDPTDPTFVETFDHVRNTSTIRWKDWTLVTVPLEDFMGQDVRIEFTTKDCDRSGHFGYAYVDAFCGDIAIESNTGKYAICPGQSLELSAPDGFADYLWSTGENTQSITVNQAGNYSVVLTPFSEDPLLNCTVTLEQEVSVSDAPIADFTFDPGCIDQFIDFTNTSQGSDAFPIETYIWDFGDGTGVYNDTNRTHAFPGPGTYTVTLEVINTGGCRDIFTEEITIPPYPRLDPINAIDSIARCQFDSIQLFAEDLGDVTYTWTGPNGYTSNERTPTITLADTSMSGEYVVEVSANYDNCLADYDTTIVNVVLFPDYRISPDETVCFNNRVVNLFASGGETYTWEPAAIFNDPTLNAPRANPDSTTLITVQTSHSLCPDSLMSMEITVDYYEELFTFPDQIDLCLGDSIKLFPEQGAPNNFMFWQSPDTIAYQDTAVIRPVSFDSLGGYYYVQAYLGENQYCQFADDSIFVNLYDLPDADINPDTAATCEGGAVSFASQNPMSTYYWYFADGDTISEFNDASTDVLDTTIYISFTDQNGCANLDSVYTESISVVKPDLGNNRVACIGDTVRVFPFNHTEIPGTHSYNWSDGSTDTMVVITNSETLILTLNNQGCTARDTVDIEFQDPADFNMGGDEILCSIDSFYLDFRGFGDSIFWSDGNRDFDRYITFPGGNYAVQIYSGACVLEDDINIFFEPFIPAVLPADTSICLGDTVNLNANPAGYSYRWFIDGTEVSTAPSLAVFEEGDHQVILESYSNVCTTSDTMRVVVLSPNALNFPDQHICETDSAFVDPSIPFNGATYTWGDGYSGARRYIKTPGQYTIQIVAGPCVIEDTLVLTNDQVPLFDLGPTQQICIDSTAVLTADNTSWPSYVWNDGTTAPNKTTNTPGLHILSAQNGLCSFSDTVLLNVDTLPVFDLGPDERICETDSFLFSTGLDASMFAHNWNNGTQGSDILVKQAGSFSVQVQNGLCSFSDQVALTTQVLPGVDLGPDQILCLGDISRIGFSANNATYSWNTGANTDSIDVSQTGNYVLTVTQDLCMEADSILVTFDQLIKPDLGPDIVQCNSISATLDASTVAQSYNWTLNGTALPFTTRSIGISAPGTYIVNAIQGTCSDADTLVATIQNEPTLSLSKDSTLCQGETYLVQSSTNAINPTYTWSTNATQPDIEIDETGIYTLTLTEGVCTVSESMEAIFVPHPYINLSPGALICENEVITIGEFFSPNGDTDTTDYSWNTGETNPTITVNVAGRYIETASIAHCFDTDYFDLEVRNLPVPVMTPDFSTCENELLPINTGLPNLTTTWSNGAGAGYEVLPAATGNYIATITDGPCTVQDSVFVTIHEQPEEQLDNVYVCPKDSLALYIEDPDLTAIWNGVAENPHIVLPGDIVNLELINNFGCRSLQRIQVFEDKNCSDDVYVPNSFTPDGDNINENFQIFLSEDVIFETFSVYDRWGHEIYRSEGSYEPWDGSYQGSAVKTGTYVFILTYENQYKDKVKKMGNITVLQ